MTIRARSLPLLLTLVLTAALQAEMTTRTFKVPPDFLSCDLPDHGSAAAPAAPGDPFAPKSTPSASNGTSDPLNSPQEMAVPEKPPPQFKTAKGVLESAGIEFPEGAGAVFSPLTGLLTVTNTVSNLDVVESFMKMLQERSPVNIACTLTVIEGPGDLIREANAQASSGSNSDASFRRLLEHARNPGSSVRIVADAFTEAQSGTRATTAAAHEYAQVTDFRLDSKSHASATHETPVIGLRFEFEPNGRAGEDLIDLTLSFTSFASPSTQRQINVSDPLSSNAAEFPATDIQGIEATTATTMADGSTRLLNVTRPAGRLEGREDVLQAVFLTTTLRRVETIPNTQPLTATRPTLPKGMSFAALPAPEGLFDNVLFIHTAIVDASLPRRLTVTEWLARSGVSFPAGASVEHRDGMLRVIHTPDGIATIASIVDQLLNKHSKTVAITSHTIEAPEGLLRALQRRTLAASDDSAMLAELEAAAVNGEARFVNSTFFEGKPGHRTTHHAACEHHFLSTMGTDGKGYPDLRFDTRHVGVTWEIEPTIRPDGRTVSLMFCHELHSAPPTTRRDHFRDPGSQKAFEMPVTDFHVLKTMADISLDKGSTKLISMTPPIGHGSAGKLWATFLKCDVVPQVSKMPPWFPTNDAGDPVVPDPKAWNTKIFRVPPDFLSIGGGDSGTAPADPFAAEGTSQAAEKQTIRKTAKTILEAQGITFPEGATAVFSAASSTLLVKNTNENLDLVEAFTDWHCRPRPRTTAFTAHVLQAPGPLLRRLTTKAATKSNHRTELDELLAAVKNGTVQHLNTVRIETKSGTRATAKQVTEHIAVSEVDVDDKGVPSLALDMRPVGFRLELEPTVGADGVTVELTLAPEFHTAPPFEHREHVIDTQGRRLEFPLTDYHATKVNTSITMPDGTVRLLSLYKPTGRPEFEKEDILQAIFISCDILRPDR